MVVCLTKPAKIPVKPQGYCPELLPTAQLLTEGGDGRIHCSTDGVNRYGCAPLPDPELLAFGSSTASTISTAGFAAAESLRERLVCAGKREKAATTYRREMDRVRSELTALYGLADLAGLKIIFGASGTDLHLFISQLMVETGSDRPLIVCVDSEETGRGVPSALAGQHFSDQSALGRVVPANSPLDCGRPIHVLRLKCRGANGNVRPLAEIDAEVEQVVAQAVSNGRRVLIALADLSKTGLILPGPDCVLGLKQRFPEAVDVLVDACQARLQGATIKAYLELDFMVAITGSKFLSGPTFSGALLVPEKLSMRFKNMVLPDALRLYSARADWPDDWKACRALDDVPNYGLLLRWEAALTELRAFARLSEADIARFIRAFGCAIKDYFSRQNLLELLPAPSLDRGAMSTKDGWDELPTIFSFLICKEGRKLNQRAVGSIYGEISKSTTLGRKTKIPRQPQDGSLLFLNHEPVSTRCQLGQPVSCGVCEGTEVSALRLCLSSRLIVEALSPSGRGCQAIIDDAITVLDKVVWLIGN